MRYYQRRSAVIGNNIRHRKSLTAARYTKKRLVLIPFVQTLGKLSDSLRLVTGRLISCIYLELCHNPAIKTIYKTVIVKRIAPNRKKTPESKPLTRKINT
jgi:hypothetical protein